MVGNRDARLRSGSESASPTGSSNRRKREDRQKDALRDTESGKRFPEMEWKQLVKGRGTASIGGLEEGSVKDKGPRRHLVVWRLPRLRYLFQCLRGSEGGRVCGILDVVRCHRVSIVC